MKRFISGFIVGAMLFGAFGVIAAAGLRDVRIADTVSLWVHGEQVETDIIYAVREDNPYGFGRNYVSARDLAEALGYQINWDGETEQIIVGGFPQFYINFFANYLSFANELAEMLGYSIEWDEDEERWFLAGDGQVAHLSPGLSEFYPENPLVPRFGLVLGEDHITTSIDDDGTIWYMYRNREGILGDSTPITEYMDILSRNRFTFDEIVGNEDQDMITIFYWRGSTLLMIAISENFYYISF